MKTIFLDFIDFERVNTLLDGFNRSTGFVTAILDLDGNILSKSGWRQICTEFHRKNSQTVLNCMSSDTELANKARDCEKYHYYQCINGLVDVALPIVIKGEHVANLFSGQFFFEEPDISYFQNQARTYGFDEDSYLKALREVPIVSKDKVEVAMNFLLSITQMIAELTFEKYEQRELNKARIKSEAALRESEAFNRIVMDNLPIGLAVNSANPEVNFTYINENFSKFYHTTREALADQDAFWEAVYENPEFRAELKRRVLGDCASGDPEKMQWENIPVTRNGQVVAYISAKNTPVPDKDLMISSVWDVTDRIKAGIALRESEEKHRFLTENSLDVIWTADLEGNLTYVSPSIEKLLGFTPQEILGMPMVDYIVREDYDILLARLKEERSNPSAEQARSEFMEARYKTKDNRLIYVELNVSWIKDGQGNFISLQGSSRDITERKQAEEALLRAYDATIEGWAHAVDLKDVETENHSRRVTELTLSIAEKMGVKEEELIHVRRGALLHDIGKIGIPDSILLKPGPLCEDEWNIMFKHPVYAYEMISKIEYLRQALDIPYCHHEKWDGSGYPQGLKGEQIPLAARIFAVVDVYDALTHDRPYRKAWSKEKVLKYIRELSGCHFDPKVVNVFFAEANNMRCSLPLSPHLRKRCPGES